MKRCASDMSEDDSTGNVAPPDGGGKKAVSCGFRRAVKRFADTMVISIHRTAKSERSNFT